MQELVYLDEATLDQMAANPAIMNEFPILQQLKGADNVSCPPCQRKKAPDRSASYGNVKTYFGTMSDDLKLRLKQLLNAKRIRVVYMKGPGIYEKQTF